MTDVAKGLQAGLGYRFVDSMVLTRALTHRSAGPAHNERLEFLGDSVLSIVISDNLYRRYPEATEGELTRCRARLVRQETLTFVAQKLGLPGGVGRRLGGTYWRSFYRWRIRCGRLSGRGYFCGTVDGHSA